MSGLEPIAALGLACNILQLVELGRNTIDAIKTVYKEGVLDHELEQNAAFLEKLANGVKKESRPGSKKYEAILLQSAVTCSTAARDLQEELHFLFGKTKRGNFVSAIRVTATVKWRERRLERLGRTLETEEKRLQTGLLAQVWSSTNSAQIDTRGVRRELRFFIEQYRQGRRETGDLVSSEGLKTRELISSEARQTYKAVAQADQKLDRLTLRHEAQMNNEVRERFLKSLKYPEFNQRRNQVRTAHEDTLKWIFVGDDADETENDHGIWGRPHLASPKHSDQESVSNVKWDSFSNWLRSTDTIYWISGKPGSGKTTLMKYVLAHPRTRMYLDVWSPGCMIVSHYFWRPGSPMQRNMEGFFCSLLYQILENNHTALKEVMSSVPDSKDSFTDWPSTELRLALLKALDTCDDGVCLFLDGLDEIKPEDVAQDGLLELLDFVSLLSQTRKVKFCLASRPNPHILEMRLSVYPQLRLQDLNSADLMAYAKEHLKCSQSEMSEDYDAMIDLFIYRAEGVFLWLILAIKSINEGILYHDNAEPLTERINHLPKGLDRLYQDMWARASADSPLEYRKTAASYFKLLISSGWTGRRSSDKESVLRGIGVFDYNGASVFDLMLATTPTADGILDALDDDSKLIDQEVVERRCREVARKLKIYCMGLVEERTGYISYQSGDASDWSWYGHTYDNLYPGATGARRLEFIHRSASDFLTDTKMGSEILDHDTSSGFNLHCQLLKARLAKLAIFASEESVDGWADLLRRIRETWKGTEQWVSKDWDRLVLICEKLANSGRLFEGVVDWAEPCGGSAFLMALAGRDSDDETIITRLDSASLSDVDKSAILLRLSGSFRGWRYGEKLQFRHRIFQALLRAGADPNLRIWETTFIEPFETVQTPWTAYLLNLLRDLTGSDFERPATDLAALAVIAVVFILEGADLDDTVDMFLHWDTMANGNWVPTGIRHSDVGDSDGVFASIPAYLIINILTETVRHSSESIQESCLDRCASLERACLNHRSHKAPRVFGKRTTPIEHGEFAVCETTQNMQVQLGNILVGTWKRQLSTRFLTDSEGSIESGTWESVFAEMPLSILNDESWVEVTYGDDALWEWLVYKDMLRFVGERPGVQDWVRMHSRRFLQCGQFTQSE